MAKKLKRLNTIIHGDSLEVLAGLNGSSVDLVLTDPPYFLDKMDNNWQHKIVGSSKNQQVIKSLPAGMKFDRQQGKNFYEWYLKISKEIFRVLKPGGLFLSFSSPRLYHRMTSAIDDAGFEVRDCLIWLYTQNQMKAMGMDHFIDKSFFSKGQKENLKNKLKGWKTPQLKSCFEPISFAQKPTEGTYLNNITLHGTGLVNTNLRVGNNMQVANVISTEKINEAIDQVFLVSKPNKQEKGGFNIHQTVKPLSLCEHLIKLLTFNEDAVVLDPFLGSGTTALAAKNLNRSYIGIEINQEYIEVAKKRIDLFQEQKINFKEIVSIPKQQAFVLG